MFALEKSTQVLRKKLRHKLNNLKTNMKFSVKAVVSKNMLRKGGILFSSATSRTCFDPLEAIHLLDVLRNLLNNPFKANTKPCPTSFHIS